MVEAFLLGEGNYRPSWRMLTHTLHRVDESHPAETIKTNAEPQKGAGVSLGVERDIIHNVCTLGNCYVFVRVCTRSLTLSAPSQERKGLVSFALWFCERYAWHINHNVKYQHAVYLMPCMDASRVA